MNRLKHRLPEIMLKKHYGQYAVMVPFIPDGQGGMDVLFEVRSAKLQRQPGEVCFPGGRMEAGETGLETAIREIQEELLIQENQIEVLGPGDVYVAPYGSIIYTYLCVLKEYQGSYSPAEVEEVFKVPLNYFITHPPKDYYNKIEMHPDSSIPEDLLPGGKAYRWAGGKYEVSFYDYEPHLIWGMTAKFMKSVVDILKNEGVQIHE